MALKKILTQDKVIEDFNSVHGVGTYDYNKVNYINAKTKVIIICKTHGQFLQKPNSHKSGNGCPKCSMSKGEKQISICLIKFKIPFKTEVTEYGCKSKKNNYLRFDFRAITEFGVIYIEYDGAGHRIAIRRGSMTKQKAEENLLLTKENDAIKDEWCRTNGHRLCRIPEQDFDNIDQILVDLFDDVSTEILKPWRESLLSVAA